MKFFKKFVSKLKFLNSAKKLRKKKIELNEEQINIIAAGAFVGFLQLLENREREFYKQLSKMRIK